MAARALDIILGVKNNLPSGMSAATRTMQDFAARANAQGTVFSAENAIKFGVAINTVRGALSAVAATISAIDGDWSRVDELLKRLPLGLGALYQTGRDLVDVATGYAVQLERAERAAKQLAGFQAASDAAFEIGSGLRGNAYGWMGEARRLGMNRFDAARDAANEAAAKRTSDIQRMSESLEAQLSKVYGLDASAFMQRGAVRFAFEQSRGLQAAQIAKIGEDELRYRGEQNANSNETQRRIESNRLRERTRLLEEETNAIRKRMTDRRRFEDQIENEASQIVAERFRHRDDRYNPLVETESISSRNFGLIDTARQNANNEHFRKLDTLAREMREAKDAIKDARREQRIFELDLLNKLIGEDI